MRQQPETCPIGLRRLGSQRSRTLGAMGKAELHRRPRCSYRPSAALTRRTVTLARCGTFLFPLSVRVGTSARALPVAHSSVSIGDGNLSACVVRHGAPGDPATRTDGLHVTPRDAGDSFFRSACRRAAASPVGESQGGLSNWWTSHRPVASGIAVRRRVALCRGRSAVSYTLRASSVATRLLPPFFPCETRPLAHDAVAADGARGTILDGGMSDLPTEAELMRGYCRTGCTTPPTVLVEGEAICCACADAMGAA